MDNQIAKLDSFNNMAEMKSFASELIASGFLPQSLKKPEQVVSVILKGRELGMGPMFAVSNIHVIQGNPVLSVHAIAALLIKANVMYKIIKDYEPMKNDAGEIVKIGDKPNYVTTVRFYRKWEGQIIEQDISFSWAEAVAQQLTGKDNWMKMP
jgi:hypothetical protein